MHRAVFTDRDGTINRDVPYCSCPEDFEFLPGVIQGIKLINEHGFKIIVITNQSGVARGYFSEETLAKIHDKMKRELTQHDAHIDAITYCPHHPDDNCECRKPKLAMLLKAATESNIDLTRSYVIGDKDMDVEMGHRAGCKTVLVSQEQTNGEVPSHLSSNFLEASQWIIGNDRGS